MRYGSVCSGIEAATVAWHGLGWEPAWFSEIERFPCAVLAHHYPTVPNLGDMLAITEATLEKHGRIDLLVGGTPCQSFSVAGLRGGLDDPRGNLALRFCQLAGVARPRWIVWENVPGVLSSGAGEDFGSIIRGMEELGYGVAWRSLDAQYFGLAQRRERVFAVGYLGDWRPAAAVLLEPEGLRGDPAPSREAWAGVTNGTGESIAGTLQRNYADKWGLDNQHVDAGCPMFITHALTSKGYNASEDGTGRDTPIVPVAFAQNQRDEVGTMSVCGALQAEPGMKQQTYVNHNGVRRLTPTECERLQGFPDGYTNVPYRGKPAADGPRYAALGNSMAVPVMASIGRKIQAVEDMTASDASLAQGG